MASLPMSIMDAYGTAWLYLYAAFGMTTLAANWGTHPAIAHWQYQLLGNPCIWCTIPGVFIPGDRSLWLRIHFPCFDTYRPSSTRITMANEMGCEFVWYTTCLYHWIVILPADRLQLNNYLQQAFQNQTTLSWEKRQLGEQHNSDWEAVAFSMIFFYADLLLQS